MANPTQLKINLSEELQDLLLSKAAKLGIPLTQYAKHVLIKDVENEEYPTFRASAQTEEVAQKALEQLDKSVDVKSFLSKLGQK